MRTWLSLTLVVLLGACGSASDNTPDAGGHADAAPAVDAGVPDAAGPACTGLSLKECRKVAGCVADLCYACSCAAEFKGCRAQADVPFECPVLDCPQPSCCGKADDCPGGGQICLDPGDHPAGCGICTPAPGNCTIDDDCTGTTICEAIRCSCEGARACVPGCTSDADCAKGDRCDVATNRCAPITCGVLTPCPPNFSCESAACVRASCATDIECDGFCVDGQCYAAQGTCELPPP